MGVNTKKIPGCYINPQLLFGGLGIGGIGTSPNLIYGAGGLAIGGVGADWNLAGLGGVAIGGVGSVGPVVNLPAGGVGIGGIGADYPLLDAVGGVGIGGVGANPSIDSTPPTNNCGTAYTLTDTGGGNYNATGTLVGSDEHWWTGNYPSGVKGIKFCAEAGQVLTVYKCGCAMLTLAVSFLLDANPVSPGGCFRWSTQADPCSGSGETHYKVTGPGTYTLWIEEGGGCHSC